MNLINKYDFYFIHIILSGLTSKLPYSCICFFCICITNVETIRNHWKPIGAQIEILRFSCIWTFLNLAITQNVENLQEIPFTLFDV